MSQAQLDALLDRQHTIPVVLSAIAPLTDSPIYNPLRNIANTGLRITPRELIHAIGSKTAALPSSQTDDCINAGMLYTHVLDLASPHIRLKDGIDSDLITPRSQEIGIGITCLIANQCFNVPWDQLGALPGPGLRFDYRGQSNGFDGIFESKGTSHRSKQSSQIQNGIRKKDAHHARGNRFDAEVIISTFVGKGDEEPRIIIGDPDFDRLADLYDQADSRFFRLRHYTRVLQFLGLPKSAYELNRYALEYLKEGRNIRRTILEEKEQTGYLQTESFGGDNYYGRWSNRIFPDTEKTDRKNYSDLLLQLIPQNQPIKVFQGIRSDIYRECFGDTPFSHNLLSDNEIAAALNRIDRPASLLPDGTIQIFSVGEL